MRQIQIGTTAIFLLLLSTAGCKSFLGEPSVASKGPKPARVVDIPAIIKTSHEDGASRKEIKALIGVPPEDESRINIEWVFPEGRFTVFYFDGKRDFMSFAVRGQDGADQGSHGLDSIEDMAALVGIDLEGKQPDEYSSVRSAYSYSLDMDGKKVSADFDRFYNKILEVRVHEIEPSGK